MMIRGMPMTKYGMEYRIRLSPLPTRSASPPRRQPVYAPRARPTTIAISSAEADEEDRRPEPVADHLDDRLALELHRVAEVALERRADVGRRAGRGSAACRGPSGPSPPRAARR